MAGGPGSERDKLTHLFVTLGKVLGVVVTLVTLVGGAVTVLFQLDPTLEPCIGGAGTQFTSVQVIPNYPLSQYLLDELGYVPSQPAPVVGAEVRYTYTADNLSGNQIVLYGTLEAVTRDGDVAFPPISTANWVPDEDLVPQRTFPTNLHAPPRIVAPSKCSEQSSGLYWMVLPPSPHPHRYRILLELYRGPHGVFNDRVGVGETPSFDF
jgi:hypothetical protein